MEASRRRKGNNGLRRQQQLSVSAIVIKNLILFSQTKLFRRKEKVASSPALLGFYSDAQL